jgi:hypothetical protein
MATEPFRVVEPKRREKKNSFRSRIERVLGRRTRRTVLLVGFLAFICLLVPRDPDFEVITLREGFPARRDLIAPFQFYLLKERPRLHGEQEAAARGVAPVYSVDPDVKPRVEALLDSLAGPGRAALLAREQGPLRTRLRELGMTSQALRLLGATEGDRIAVLARRIADRAYADGMVPELESARLETEASGASVEREGMRVHVPWEKLNDVWYNYVKGHNPYEYFGLYDVSRYDTIWLDK